ncbi:DUF3016 domain-containing protein [Shewanella sp. A32]|uniref:DUF3016 domain-containing protein n=1 Tax=Shewanella sp. A32 TaxID=3031327 RepID=UPI0023BA0429|nr:DUF3016 domain-containing protein [Shewanella sp. A32]MDF0534734.1 DUF3016 domain-containing protein [Shewanella sp. A32]
MKIGYLLFAGMLGVMSTGCAVATEEAADAAAANPITTVGKVKIEWQNPDKYRDIRTASELQKRFQQRMFESLTKALDQASSKVMKDKEKLELVVTDVDLAGDLRPTFGKAAVSEIRVVKDIYPPQINFTYRVLDGDQVIMVGSEKLHDLMFMNRIYANDNTTFRYEEGMLKDWFNKTVAPKL